MREFQARIDYDREYLAPCISPETIDYHYGKHHSGYAKNLNSLIRETQYAGMDLQEIIVQTRGINPKIFNNAAQLFNPDFYWKCLKVSNDKPSGKLLDIIKSQFNSFDNFLEKYAAFAGTLFGSGWCWVIYDPANGINFLNTQNAETPLGSNVTPVCVIDLWEHAYYIDFRNDRNAYINKLLSTCINWDFCKQQIQKV